MPISYIDVPPGIRVDAKKKLVKEVYTALDEAYRVPDTRIFLREWPLENVSQDGRLDLEPAKPVVFLEVPPGIRTRNGWSQGYVSCRPELSFGTRPTMWHLSKVRRSST